MTRVKICGITRPEDAQLAASLGASAIGFIFWPRSPRCLTPERARDIAGALPPFVAVVGVFVDQAPADVRDIAAHVGLAAVQLHGNEAIEPYMGGTAHVIKAVAVPAGADPDATVDGVPETVTVLLDAHDPIRRGGTGRTIDWNHAARVAARRPTILSGGLTPETVADAVRTVRPYAVDVSSGVESAPGVKSPERLRAFFATLNPNPGF